jgi:hypothetical protein
VHQNFGKLLLVLPKLFLKCQSHYTDIMADLNFIFMSYILHIDENIMIFLDSFVIFGFHTLIIVCQCHNLDIMTGPKFQYYIIYLPFCWKISEILCLFCHFWKQYSDICVSKFWKINCQCHDLDVMSGPKFQKYIMYLSY